MKSSQIKTYYDFLKDFDSKSIKENYYFSKYNDDSIIDGKYFYAYLNQNDGDIFVYKTNDFDQIKDSYNGLKLVLALRSKKVKIIENVTLNQEINKEVNLYDRLFFKKDKKLTQYKIEEVSDLDEMYNYSGEKLQVLSKDFNNSNAIYLPNYNLKGYYSPLSVLVIENESSKYVVLPSYKSDQTFSKYITSLKDAYIEDFNSMAKYDYFKVKSLINK